MSRFDYVKYGDIAQLVQNETKEKCMALEAIINALADGRAKSLAITKLEETYMWIGKAIRDQQIASGEPSPLQEERKDG